MGWIHQGLRPLKELTSLEQSRMHALVAARNTDESIAASVEYGANLRAQEAALLGSSRATAIGLGRACAELARLAERLAQQLAISLSESAKELDPKELAGYLRLVAELAPRAAEAARACVALEREISGAPVAPGARAPELSVEQAARQVESLRQALARAGARTIPAIGERVG